jgi:translation initiation factor IF-2
MDDNKLKKPVRIPATITVKRFAQSLALPVSLVMTELMKNKILATINEEIDFDTASIIAQDLGFKTEIDEISEGGALTLEKLVEICKKEKEIGKNLQPRPPIVTILGHVDHGKTTLLDTIRKTAVAMGEAGGITQHIHAYQARKRGKIITFVDTPGHEAFSAMRERGVGLADIAILVVAADDGVRPQTKEVIRYLKDKKIPTVVAINKIDKPEANVQKIKQELADNGILLEEWGGGVLASEISAKKNIGVDALLENLLLVAEVEDFRADAKRDGLAVVLESHLDPQKGPTATILVKTGTFRIGQDIFAGGSFGRIRKMDDFSGKNIESAGPSAPVTIIGLSNAPNTNDIVQVVGGKTAARLASKEARDKIFEKRGKGTIPGESEEGMKKLNLVIKADVQGSLEAILQILSTIQAPEVLVTFIETGVGNITESDIKLAQTSQSLVLGFNTEATPVAKRLAEGSQTKIKIFKIIYELVGEVKKEISSLLPAEIIRTDLGHLNVLAIFKTGKRDMIVGGRVSEGKMAKGALIEVKREGEIIGRGKIANLQQNKANADEVKQGNECGITFEGNIKIKAGDTLVAYIEEEKKRTL